MHAAWRRWRRGRCRSCRPVGFATRHHWPAQRASDHVSCMCTLRWATGILFRRHLNLPILEPLLSELPRVCFSALQTNGPGVRGQRRVMPPLPCSIYFRTTYVIDRWDDGEVRPFSGCIRCRHRCKYVSHRQEVPLSPRAGTACIFFFENEDGMHLRQCVWHTHGDADYCLPLGGRSIPSRTRRPWAG